MAADVTLTGTSRLHKENWDSAQSNNTIDPIYIEEHSCKKTTQR